MRLLKHLGVFFLCAFAALLLGYWGLAMSLATFAPGGDVTFSDEQKRRAALGETILAVYDWPSQHLLRGEQSWTLSSLCYGAVFYGAFVGLHRCFRRRAT